MMHFAVALPNNLSRYTDHFASRYATLVSFHATVARNVHHATCITQRASRNVHHATCITQRASRNVCGTQPAAQDDCRDLHGVQWCIEFAPTSFGNHDRVAGEVGSF
jgi:hypothetical protein